MSMTNQGTWSLRLGEDPYTSDQEMQLRHNNKKCAESEYHSWCCDGCVSGAVSAASTGE